MSAATESRAAAERAEFLAGVEVKERIVSTPDDGGPAFPRDHRNDGHNGMTLRDYFAARAMQAQVIRAAHRLGQDPVYRLAINAYEIADHMLRARQS